eukprot:GILJ01004622.1.p1 GENE.GILJ01004622.1~~GILJ01004622.1.p1  ORF type:complete len:703 (-),score=106.97 GILJ01004622.1:138-2246(-)
MSTSVTVYRKPKHRIARACVSCHNLKASCDNSRPCKRCRDRGIGASCVDHIGRKRSKRSRTDTKREDESPEAVVVDLPPDIAPFPHVDRAESQQFNSAAFTYLFNSIQYALHKCNRLPSPQQFANMLSLWRLTMTKEQIAVLIDYLSSFGDQAYGDMVNAARSVPPVCRKPLKDPVLFETMLSRVAPENRSAIMNAVQLDQLPIALVYAVLDSRMSECYYHPNAALKEMTGLSDSDQLARFYAGEYTTLIHLFAHPDSLLTTLIDVGYHMLMQSPKYSVPIIVGSHSGVKQNMRMDCSIYQLQDGIRSFSFCLLPLQPAPPSPVSVPFEMTPGAVPTAVKEEEAIEPIPLLPKFSATLQQTQRPVSRIQTTHPESAFSQPVRGAVGAIGDQQQSVPLQVPEQQQQQQQLQQHSPRTKKTGSMSTLDLDFSLDISAELAAAAAVGDNGGDLAQRARSLSPQRQTQTFPLTVAAAQLESPPPLSLFTSLSSIEYHLHDIGKTKKAMAETVALGRTNSFKLEGKHVRSSMAISNKKEMERRLEVALQVAEKQKKEMQSLRSEIQRTWSDLSLHLRPNPSSLPPSPSKDSTLRSTGALSTSHTATMAAAAAVASATAAEEADSNMYEEIKNLRESLDARVRLVPTTSEKQQQLKCKRQSSLGSLQKRPVVTSKGTQGSSEKKLLIMLKPVETRPPHASESHAVTGT